MLETVPAVCPAQAPAPSKVPLAQAPAKALEARAPDLDRRTKTAYDDGVRAAVEAQRAHFRSMEAEARPLEARLLEARPLEARLLEARPLEARPPEARPPEAEVRPPDLGRDSNDLDRDLDVFLGALSPTAPPSPRPRALAFQLETRPDLADYGIIARAPVPKAKAPRAPLKGDAAREADLQRTLRDLAALQRAVDAPLATGGKQHDIEVWALAEQVRRMARDMTAARDDVLRQAAVAQERRVERKASAEIDRSARLRAAKISQRAMDRDAALKDAQQHSAAILETTAGLYELCRPSTLPNPAAAQRLLRDSLARYAAEARLLEATIASCAARGPAGVEDHVIATCIALRSQIAAAHAPALRFAWPDADAPFPVGALTTLLATLHGQAALLDAAAAGASETRPENSPDDEAHVSKAVEASAAATATFAARRSLRRDDASLAETEEVLVSARREVALLERAVSSLAARAAVLRPPSRALTPLGEALAGLLEIDADVLAQGDNPDDILVAIVAGLVDPAGTPADDARSADARSTATPDGPPPSRSPSGALKPAAPPLTSRSAHK
ncbi:hypothetical protein M885DRAFT_618497 [Pelagophyceae sp. CCMP2097]|nr:hypothetical protein M885DRAFT_618497 [Pelagophyceae sp. CCMP2097]